MYEASIRPPPQPLWRWTKFIARLCFYIIAPVLYLIVHQRGGGRCSPAPHSTCIAHDSHVALELQQYAGTSCARCHNEPVPPKASDQGVPDNGRRGCLV